MIERLYSPKKVIETFPDGHRPSLRRLITTAKQANCCCKLGKGIGFTQDQVKMLQAYISCPSPSSVTPKGRNRNKYTGPLPPSPRPTGAA